MEIAIVVLSVINGMMILVLIYFLIIYVATTNKSKTIESVSIVSKEQTNQIDEALGLIKASTYLEEELYNRTIDKICNDFDIVPAAALRRLIEVYDSNQWAYLVDQEDCEYPFEDELVLIKDDNQTGYLFGSYNFNKKEWSHIDDKNVHHPLPENFVVTQWKTLD